MRKRTYNSKTDSGGCKEPPQNSKFAIKTYLFNKINN